MSEIRKKKKKDLLTPDIYSNYIFSVLSGVGIGLKWWREAEKSNPKMGDHFRNHVYNFRVCATLK